MTFFYKTYGRNFIPRFLNIQGLRQFDNEKRYRSISCWCEEDNYEQYLKKDFIPESNTLLPGSTVWHANSSFPFNKTHDIIYPSSHILEPTAFDWKSWERSFSSWYIPKGICPNSVKVWGRFRLE